MEYGVCVELRTTRVMFCSLIVHPDVKSWMAQVFQSVSWRLQEGAVDGWTQLSTSLQWEPISGCPLSGRLLRACVNCSLYTRWPQKVIHFLVNQQNVWRRRHWSYYRFVRRIWVRRSTGIF